MVTIGITPDGNTRRPRPTYSLDLTELHWALHWILLRLEITFGQALTGSCRHRVEHPEHFKNAKADAGSWAGSWELKWGLSGDSCTRFGAWLSLVFHGGLDFGVFFLSLC